MSAALAAIVAAVTLAGATPHAPRVSSAGPFLLEEIRMKVDGRWGLAWRSLYPLHRKVAPRSVYVRCEARDPFVAPVDSMQVVRARRALVQVAGLGHLVPGVAVTLRATFPGYGPRDPIVFTHTFHLVPVDGQWTWLLSAQRYALYAHEGCRNLPAL